MEMQSMRLGQKLILFTVAFNLAIFTGACSSKPFLKVHYQLPSTSQMLDGQKVSLSVADARKNSAFLTQPAKKSLKGFKGTFSLVVLREDGSGDLVGAYELSSLLTEVFRQRLEASGLQVITAGDSDAPVLEILVKEFNLDLASRKWIVTMNYQARLKKAMDLLASESVNGSAERLKVVGKSDAEKIMSELLTDMVNKLDLAKLFQQIRQ